MDKNDSIQENFISDKTKDDYIPEEVKNMRELQNVDINNYYEGKEQIKTLENKNKEFKTNKLVLNEFWIQLVSSITFAASLIIYETMIVLAGSSFLGISKGDLSPLKASLTMLLQDIGVKWLFITILSQHLSIGFFCLTNFSYILKETKNPLKFFIKNIIKCVLYYFISVIVIVHI